MSKLRPKLTVAGNDMETTADGPEPVTHLQVEDSVVILRERVQALAQERMVHVGLLFDLMDALRGLLREGGPTRQDWEKARAVRDHVERQK